MLKYLLMIALISVFTNQAAANASSLKINYIFSHKANAILEQSGGSQVDVSLVTRGYQSPVPTNTPYYKAIEPILNVVKSNLTFYSSFDEHYSASISFDDQTGKVIACTTPLPCEVKSFCQSTTGDLGDITFDVRSLREISTIQLDVEYQATEVIADHSQNMQKAGAISSAAPRPATGDAAGLSPIQREFKSARITATTGAIIYGAASAVEVAGVIMVVNNAEGHYSTAGGTSVMLAGEAVELAGTIVSNIGGYNARSGYEALNETAPQFRGWIYFAAGLVCSVGGSLLSQTDFPLFPTIISISGFGFTLSSIIHSTNYASKAYMKSIVLQDVKIAPLVDRKLHVNGIRIAADF